MGDTFKLALITVPLGLALGVGLAVLADKQLRGIGFFRTVFSSTVATSVAVASLMWLFLLQPEVGVLANIGWLNDLFPSLKEPGLLRDPGTALASVASSSVWASLGFTFILVTAGAAGHPRGPPRGGRVDGAGGMRAVLAAITLPMLGPTLLFVVVVLTTRAFQAYGEIDLLTERRAPAGATDDDDHLPDYGERVDRSPTTIGLQVGHRGAAVRRAAGAVVRAVPRHRQAGALWRADARPPRASARRLAQGRPLRLLSSSPSSCCSRSTRR